jgi:4-diphosphocytidyl-2C-methyl-D-erythritol kinase
MTGSGSCVFALTQTQQQRDQVAQRVVVPDGYRLYTCSFWNGEAWRSAA